MWDTLEWINSIAFGLRYRKGLKAVGMMLADVTMTVKGQGDEMTVVTFKQGGTEDAARLADFFARQPEESFTYFRPHAFDEHSIGKLLGRKSFVVMLAMVGDEVVGYAFLRSFVHGRGYLGKIVDTQWQGRGICKRMCLIAMDVALTLGIHMYESININNKASMSSSSVLRQVVVQELDGGDLLFEDLPL